MFLTKQSWFGVVTDAIRSETPLSTISLEMKISVKNYGWEIPIIGEHICETRLYRSVNKKVGVNFSRLSNYWFNTESNLQIKYA